MRKNLLQSLSKDRSNSAFTLLELLIVFGVVSILSVAVITVINPGELLLSTRDGKRMSDLSTLNRILGLYLVNEGSSFGSASTIYISLPSDNPDCSDLELPELQSPYSYHCQTEANHKKVDGNGWVPVDLTTIPLGTPMSSLPTDPVNDNQYYYTYTPDPSNRTWELTAPIVSLSKKKYAQNDGGNDPNLFEIGANLISAPQIAYVYNPLEDQVFTGIGVVYAQSAPTAGQVSVFSDATHIYGTDNLFWDTGNTRLGIGTATPSYKLDVQTGQVNASGGLCIAGDCKTAWSQVQGTNYWTVSGNNIYNNNSGNVGIGKIPGSYALDVNGNVNATAYYGSGANLSGIVVPDNSISTAKLKTTTGEVNSYVGGDGVVHHVTLPGGEYGFYPQIRAGSSSAHEKQISIGGEYASNTSFPTSYTTQVSFRSGSGHTDTLYAKQRYVTASGEDYWIFLLTDNNTKGVISIYAAPDHPAYGNGGDFDKLSHPFADYNSNTQEIILIEKEQAKAIQQEADQKNLGVLELIDSKYKIDFTQTYGYEPIHSGQFLETEPVLVEHIPDYIQVGKFVEMTATDKQTKKELQEEKLRQYGQEKQIKDQKYQEAVDKLKALGLTEEEIKEITK
ncbi:MAG: prepilin-type N-terminal cleavage/methylation domain-containing protein [Candidatus Paceibacterota bacterium]